MRETARTVSGTVERAVAAVTDKAELSSTIEHVVEPFKQWAVVLIDIPNAVLEARDAFRTLFDGSKRFEVQKSIDAYRIARILAAKPAGTTGSGLVAQIRNAVAAMLQGANPSLLALSPTDAAALDLFDDTGGSLVFATRSTGSSSPVWDLRVTEVVGLDDPLLIDPAMLGVFPLVGIRVDADPFTGFKKASRNCVPRQSASWTSATPAAPVGSARRRSGFRFPPPRGPFLCRPRAGDQDARRWHGSCRATGGVPGNGARHLRHPAFHGGDA